MSAALWIAIGVFLLLMFLKTPVWASVLCSTCSYLILTPQAINSIVVVQKIITGMSGLSLLAVCGDGRTVAANLLEALQKILEQGAARLADSKAAAL